MNNFVKKNCFEFFAGPLDNHRAIVLVEKIM